MSHAELQKLRKTQNGTVPICATIQETAIKHRGHRGSWGKTQFAESRRGTNISNTDGCSLPRAELVWFSNRGFLVPGDKNGIP
jgi:hypothetical protein